ncbi:hypothetical protein QFC22_005519 [Naganishia vaughanmartiniae]|uniref:Uncharacterized protein n=1 Tax=Naganishia vaughanmartiniae TaxID=1424756 RepID=A0ACC2WT23_9TREE|nr:hypothetical protein QFC22_005519 [Naganishia vaughanmartiniae]
MVDDYDSDGGLSDASSVTRTNVLLASIEPKLKVSTSTHTSSFAGGYPAFPSLPSSSSSSIPADSGIKCGNCHAPMPLLSQIYCPMEQGENDRTLYVWACPKAACQRRAGSVRAFRASARNEVYAADAAEKRAKAEAEVKRLAEAEQKKKEAAKVNPFAIGAGTASTETGFGNALFGSAGTFGTTSASNPFAAPSTSDAPPSDAFSTMSISSPEPAGLSTTKSTTTKTAQGPATPATTFGPPLPAYIPAQAIDSYPEDIPKATSSDKDAARKGLVDEDAAADLDDEETGGKGGKKSAANVAEQWERVLPKGMDEVFERFVNRLNVAIDGNEQVLRYDLGGVPLPYSEKSDLYKKLFPPKSLAGRHVPVIQSNADDEEDDDENSYEKRFTPYPTVPVCAKCNSRRVFEVQLVSSMISYLAPERLSTTGKAPSKKKKKSAAEKAKSLEERRKEVEALLQGKSLDTAEGGEVDQAQQGVGMGMEWGSVVVFGCEGDCVGFSEEWVGVEWEEDQ